MSASTVFQMNTGDLTPSLQASLENPDGSPVNLQGCTVQFVLMQYGQVLFTKAASVVNASNGVVQYNWQLGDTNQYGVCQGLFIVTLSSGLAQTFPVTSPLYIIFPLQPSSVSTTPTLTSFTDAMANLNVQGPDATGNYTIYGLSVTQIGLQAQVNYANKYVYSLLPNIPASDLRYSFLQLAALNLACMRVLVLASGGVLNGAVDYTLGDISMRKGTVTQWAFTGAVNAFKLAYEDCLTNFSSGGVTARNQLANSVPRRHWYNGYGE